MPKSTKGQSKNKEKYIYLDYSASVFANPSSVHSAGVVAKNELQNARKAVADILGARLEEIIFTSGGTESNNLAIQGVVWAWYKNNKGKNFPHLITTNIEHPSVLETFKLLEERKLAQISIIPVEKNGIVDPKKIKKEIKTNTLLVSVMYANNEIGTIQPIKEIAKEIRHYKKTKNSKLKAPSYPYFHTDAVQAVNYLDLNVEKLGVDLLSLSGSKIEEAGRVGVLYKKKNVPYVSVFGGGDQEYGLRPGTENLKAIVQFSKALQLIQKIKDKEVKRLTKLRDYFINQLSRYPFDVIVVNGDLKNRLPNNISASFKSIPSDLLVIELSEKGVMTSAKSACKSGEVGGSYVIEAIHPDFGKEVGAVRFSLGRQTSKSDIDYTIKVLKEVLIKLKKWYN